MKKSKIISEFIKAFKTRPIVFFALAVLLVDICYVNLLFRWPEVPLEASSKENSATGRVRSKEYDETGLLKSVTIDDTLCYVNKCTDVEDPNIGSIVKITGSFSLFEAPYNYGEFNSKKYYASKKVYYLCFPDSFHIVKNPRFSVRENFLKLKRKLSTKVKEYCPLEAGTVNTLLLGDKSELSKERKKLYMDVGVGHFLVISGLHISAIGSFIYLCLRRMYVKVKPASLISIFVLLLYGLLVGFSVSVIRALIMFSVRLFSDFLKRIYDMLNAVSFALIISLCLNPLFLFDTAFIYSYLTVFSIAVYFTYLQPNQLRVLSFKGFIREALRIPFVLCLFILPVTLYFSYSYSIMSIILNGILTPLSGPILLIAFFCFLFSNLRIAIASKISDAVLAMLLRLFDLLCKLISEQSIFTIRGKPSLVLIAAYYSFLICYFFILRNRFGNLQKLIVFCSLIFLFSLSGTWFQKVNMLYVGQGECIIIENQKGHGVVVDCGSTSKSKICENTVVPFIKASGIDTIDGIFVSHEDKDHSGEVVNLVNQLKEENISVNGIYISSVYTPLYKDFCNCGIRVYVLDKGDSVSFPGTSIYVCSPDKRKLSGDANEDSLIMLSSLKHYDIMLTGDATKNAEERVTLKRKDFKRPLVLKVSHHGSNTATSEAFLDSYFPDIAILSAGINNPYGHPHKETIKRLLNRNIKTYSTNQGGQISIIYLLGHLRVLPH